MFSNTSQASPAPEKYFYIYTYLIPLRRRLQATGRDTANYDPLYKVRPLVESLNSKFPQFFKPGKNVSIDESMVGFNGRLYFKQYILSKETNQMGIQSLDDL